MNNSFLPKKGGYKKLLSYQKSVIIYDCTYIFCERFFHKYDRTIDQMVQAARSGVQNIAEGSSASATSKKTELKLTQVARASLEELKLDYEDFLRHRNLPLLDHNDPVLIRFKERRIKSVEELQAWVKEERKLSQGKASSAVPVSPYSSVPVSVPLSSQALVANAALSLLNLACYLLDKQVNRLADDFLQNGGFTEKLYRERSNRRKN
jgi:four helix bundle suffix protein